MMIRHIDPQLLRTFAMVAETGNMTRASRVLNLTQGAVSQHIKRLEEQFGAALFVRERSGLTLTEMGDRLFARGRQLLALNDDLWREMTTPRFRGRVALGVPVDLISGRLPSILRHFAQAYPDVEIDLSCRTSPELRAAFEAGDLDVTLIEEPVDAASGAVLRRDRLIWVGAPGGRATTRDPLPLSLISRSCAFRQSVVAALDAAGRPWRCVYESDTLEATIAMIRMDLAVGTFLTSALPDGVEPVAAANGLPDLPQFATSLLNRETQSDTPAGALADYLAQGFTETGALYDLTRKNQQQAC